MKGRKAKFQEIFIWATLSLCLTGCGGAKVLKEPEPIVTTQAVAVAADQQLSARLDWVIVRGGPGTWAKNADWDEYLISMQNLGGTPLTITSIRVFDSLGTPINPGTDRKKLVKGAKRAKKRYEDDDIKVKAGAGTGTLLASGAVVAGASAAVVASTIMTTSSAGAVAATGGLILVPALAVGGVFRGVNNSKVNDMIESRQTLLPLELEARSEQKLNVFFPLTPSPRRVEVNYSDLHGEYTLIIDTQDALVGLHISD
ncbi:MAG: hypothetical protein R3192_16875 [Woeseiaceae bacterium]|nr:hypothetical protein [Woeseiaceae bacterium]